MIRVRSRIPGVGYRFFGLIAASRASTRQLTPAWRWTRWSSRPLSRPGQPSRAGEPARTETPKQHPGSPRPSFAPGPARDGETRRPCPPIPLPLPRSADWASGKAPRFRCKDALEGVGARLSGQRPDRPRDNFPATSAVRAGMRSVGQAGTPWILSPPVQCLRASCRCRRRSTDWPSR